jgi:two-component system sensor histidine kinase KdpD
VNDARSPTSARGVLRVYLGAAPGVGKTYKMLEEGRRRLERGTDVVIAVVETHGRERTARLLDGFEIVPRRTVTYRGAQLDDMDVDAVLARRPEVALVDEMAHTNAPGSRHEKRWEDIDELLDAGIDVITTVNIQHLESLNDALTRITGVEQQETIPDEIVRRADQIELVDMAPEALRRRIVHGNVYPRDRVDAALGNYFRVGNLGALRELALLWVADRVDDELLEYRDEHGIRRPWETRERIVVAITGAPTGEHLIRRASRMAERSRAELVGVHVRRSDGLGRGSDDTVLAHHRRLLADLGGRYHEVVGDDPAEALVSFARGENATQLVLGTSRRTRLNELLHGSIINRAIRTSPDIDVHVIAHDATPSTGATGDRRRRWRRELSRPLPRRRLVAAWLVAIAGPPLLTLMFVPFRDDEGLPGVLPAYMLIVVASALLGGTAPALVASVLGFMIGNVSLTRPYGTLRITQLSSVVALSSFLAIGLIVALVVGRLGRRTVEAERARAQAQALSAAAATLADTDAVAGLLDKLRAVLGLQAVAIDDAGRLIAVAGNADRLEDTSVTRLDLGEGRSLITSPAVESADDRLLVRAFSDQLVAALRRNELTRAEHEAASLTEIDRFRTALLRSVSHDLRTPLASIKASASSLLQDDIHWPPDVQREFISMIVEESDRLDRIVANLLDASRLEAGVLAVTLGDIEAVDVVERVLAAIPEAAHVIVAGDLDARVVADRGLLERVIENVVRNAARHAPGPIEVEIRTQTDVIGPATVSIDVVDHGPGVPVADRSTMFGGFQRLDDHGPGVGLGLAVAQGFVSAMGGSLQVIDTAGGGLTMQIVLPRATCPSP